jgi:hypothetical protein
MRIRTLWFSFFVMLMLLLPPLFAQMSRGGVPDPADSGAVDVAASPVDEAR